jgi:hypothetical protein
VKANRAYHLIASRDGPPLLSGEERIEVVSIDDGEVVLYWELPPRLARRVLRELRADLAGLDAAEFLDKWVGADVALED